MCRSIATRWRSGKSVQYLVEPEPQPHSFVRGVDSGLVHHSHGFRVRDGYLVTHEPLVTRRCFTGELADQRRLKAIGVPRFRGGRPRSHEYILHQLIPLRPRASKPAKVSPEPRSPLRRQLVPVVSTEAATFIQRLRRCRRLGLSARSIRSRITCGHARSTPGARHLWLPEQGGGHSQRYALIGSNAQYQPCPRARPDACRDGATPHSAAREKPGEAA
jgi:hypothetical protein